MLQAINDKGQPQGCPLSFVQNASVPIIRLKPRAMAHALALALALGQGQGRDHDAAQLAVLRA